MDFKILTCAKIRQQFVLEGEAEYLKRLKPWAKVRMEEVEVSSKLPEAELKRKEADAVLSRIERGEFFIALDERGKELSSEQLARFIESKMQSGHSRFVFGVGGAAGWDESVRTAAGFVLSLSKLTFPYQLTRLILVEQLYRALSIIKGQPYHKR
ncbi:MAG: 23S rRNA (pseudouridine(1915)-N(3))-methyltransferase RlmH [Proteobacteria bacterium]|nr:23S rRNA (pseudouridine(1915)-N(3))-methyltransferase RlmH [Pseudomonadota bacterium]